MNGSRLRIVFSILLMLFTLCLFSLHGCTTNKYQTLDLGKGVTTKLTLIPAGKFVMGSPETETDHQNNEGPQREVTISKSFYMGVYEVTQPQWRAVMGTEPWNGKMQAKTGGSNAATNVRWYDAVKFCEILSKKTGKKVTLPTEAQWEYACRAGSKTAYCFGDDSSKVRDDTWYDKNGIRVDIDETYTHAVGQKKRNAFGLYDMDGNAWEWCRDWYDEKFYAKAKNIDPENTTESKHRVFRGGTWYFDPQDCRAASRGGSTPGNRHISLGFRVVVLSGVD